MINHSFIKKKLKELLIKYYQETVADDHRRQSLESINLLKKDDFEKQKGQYSSIDVETLLCQGRCSGSLHHFLPYQQGFW